MSKNILLIVLISSWLSALAQTEPAVIPQPVKVVNIVGTYKIPANASITFKGFTNVPQNLKHFATEIMKVKANKEHQNANSTGLVLKLNKMLKIPDEGYLLSVNANGINISSNSEKGLFYGLQTLLQLIPDDGNKISFTEIEDYPQYRYRGLHLDVGRHLFPVAFIKQYIDLIAQYKLNTFHWHLTEDQGWRIEIKKYPKLTSIGGYRDQTLIGKFRVPPVIYDSTRYGGFYTQDEIKGVVAYAASKYVTIIPEIEMPGHSVAALSAYPQLACGYNPGPFKARQTWGVSQDVYCAGKEETFKFLEDVLDEVMPLFPSKYIHIGGDECPKDRWKTCPYCQKRIKDLGLRDEHELQSYFIQRIEKYVNSNGKQIIGWDEILEGGLAKNAVVMSWRGIKGRIAAAQQDHDVIMTPGTYLYFDHTESKSTEEPITNGKSLPLSTVYSYNPTAVDGLTPAQQKHIIGVQANVWTEYMATPTKVLYMLLPRLYALSEIAWTAPDKKNWQDFSEIRVPVHLGRLEKTGNMYHVPDPIGASDTTLTADKYVLNYKVSVKGAKIYYTINGYFPYQTDNLYEKPVTVYVPSNQERTIKTVEITPSGKRSATITTVVSNKSK